MTVFRRRPRCFFYQTFIREKNDLLLLNRCLIKSPLNSDLLIEMHELLQKAFVYRLLKMMVFVQDKECVENATLSLSTLVINLCQQEDILKQISSDGLIVQSLQLVKHAFILYVDICNRANFKCCLNDKTAVSQQTTFNNSRQSNDIVLKRLDLRLETFSYFLFDYFKLWCLHVTHFIQQITVSATEISRICSNLYLHTHCRGRSKSLDCAIGVLQLTKPPNIVSALTFSSIVEMLSAMSAFSAHLANVLIQSGERMARILAEISCAAIFAFFDQSW